MIELAERVFVIFNACEGLFWIGIAVGFAVVLLRRRVNPDLMLAGCLLFVAFGISDFVEIRTGAWFRPWWLLVWKSWCVVGLIAVYSRFRARARRAE